VKYDLAIDLYPFFPTMAGLMWRAAIPARAGFTSGGGGPLHTHRLDWQDDRAHVTTKQRRLIDVVLPPGKESPSGIRYSLTPVSAEAREHARNRLAALNVVGDYAVIHPGAGAALKGWVVDRWRDVAAQLSAEGLGVVLTGSGVEEKTLAQSIAKGIDGCVDVVGMTTWSEFVNIVSGARVAISPDTATAHVAAAMGTPCVVLFSGINDLREWMPIGSRVVPLINAVPCAPCFRKHGCATMSCVRDISADVVASEALKLATQHA
jgi:ADP-heptose:LPS heptosyltransferase